MAAIMSLLRSEIGYTGGFDGSRAAQVWLFALAALVFLMVVVGGATRLTDSGLSITEWKPIVGILPPLSDADWHDAFTKYQQIPEYHRVNRGMSLDAFKFIFWWEWTHRFLGRLIGFAFAIPFVLLLATRRLPREIVPRLIGVFALGGLQGAIGWYMVQSGLVDRVDVSQYRLALHLTVAVLIFGLLLWMALDLGTARTRTKPAPLSPGNRRAAAVLTGLVLLQIVLGAFVAGLKAGLSHNTWPLMDGQVIPDGLGVMSPWYLNLFENVLTVQFNHRMVAYLVAIVALWHTASVLNSCEEPSVRISAVAIGLAVLAQIAIGVCTLLAHVPLSLGLTHQAGAVVVFAVSVWHLHGVLRA
jgi:cytochrome c oxidase assembly protein subunit 15